MPAPRRFTFARLRRRRRPVVGALLTAVLTTLALVPAVGADAAPSTGQLALRVLSNRADLISGGDALVTVDVPPGVDPGSIAVDVNGRDVTEAFGVRDDGTFSGLVTGLGLGESLLRARAAGATGAQLEVTNHPIGGPVFSGPQIQPWTCSEGARDAQCNRPPAFRFLYKSTEGGELRPYDQENPPSDVATTTTDDGKSVPFIVREETGVLARDQYRIAVLYDPAKPWAPTAPQDGYNHKLVITHGASCDTAYAMANAPDVLNEEVISRGFAVMSHALDNSGHNCNIATEAESLVMTKEYLVDHYGTVRYTIGTGCSGGSLVQQQVANAYPGLYQGITPQCSYPDAWSSAMQYVDYDGLLTYFKNPQKWAPGTVWEPVQIEQVLGHPNPANPITFTTVIPNSGKPTRSCPGLSEEQVYNAETNPDGVRCTLQDYMRNVFGVDDETGFARRPADNVGIMYGLKGLLDGTLLPQQFVDVNTKIGGRDIDYNQTAERTAGDPLALQRAYRSGAVNSARYLDQVAIIDMRGPDPGAFHDVYRTYALRERLLREHGTADNQVIWRGTVPILGDTTFVNQGIFAVDRWLTAVERDGRDIPLAQKIIDARSTAVVDDRCTDGAGHDMPTQYCEAIVAKYATPRIAAGMPHTDDVMKCQLKPLRRADFPNVLFTDDQWLALRTAFPTGVCDYNKPDPTRVESTPWLTYQDSDGSVVSGGKPLGDPPWSIPLQGHRGR